MTVEVKPETKPKIDFDQVKQAINQLTLLDILPIAIATINSLREFGEFVIAIGNLQQKSQSGYEVVLQVGGEPQAFLAVLVDKIPQEKLKPLVELSLEMGSIQSKLVDFAKLSSIEKVEIGEKLKEAARKMSTILQEMRT
jgi:ketol-acid reductoisomerase